VVFFHTARTVPKSIEKYHTVRTVPKSIEKYHTVRTVPKSNRKIPHCQNSSKIYRKIPPILKFAKGYCGRHHIQQYISYIVLISFIGGENLSTRRKPLTCCKSLKLDHIMFCI
jgi:hypothetical protein